MSLANTRADTGEASPELKLWIRAAVDDMRTGNYVAVHRNEEAGPGESMRLTFGRFAILPLCLFRLPRTLREMGRPLI